VLAAAVTAESLAQSGRGFDRSADAWCGDGSSVRASYCQVREETIQAVNPLEIDARPNGSIRILGWDSNDALVHSRIVGYADIEGNARRIVSGVRIVTAGGGVHAEGPVTSAGEQWQVSFELHVPRAAILTLITTNGGISVDDFRGAATIHVTNGGVSLRSVGGDIHGETTNGGVSVDLAGDRWDGAGLDVRTHNGGIRITLPKDYSAALEVGTSRGRLNIDFPISVQGTIGRHIDTVLGSGGARIRAITTNGGVTIRQR
jgi:hypothetical protein